MLGYDTNSKTVVGVWKSPQDIHKEISIIISVTSIKTIRSLCLAVKISSVRRVKKALIFSLQIMICIEKM